MAAEGTDIGRPPDRSIAIAKIPADRPADRKLNGNFSKSGDFQSVVCLIDRYLQKLWVSTVDQPTKPEKQQLVSRSNNMRVSAVSKPV